MVFLSQERDKAVFCEKPLAGSLAGIDELYELAKRRGLHLFCAFQRRFDPSFVDVKKAVGEGRVGTVHVVKSCSRDNPLPPIDFLRTSGGIFHDCAVHDIDIVCWMLGEWPESVVAVAHTHLASIAELDDSDTVAITMKFPSGVIAVIDLSRHGVYGYDQRVEVFGTDGMMVADNQRPTSCSISDRQGTLSAPFQYTFLQRYETAYKVELEHFLRVLAGQETMTVTSETTRMVCRVATACETSSRQQRLVKLSEFSS
ncbi:PREDICTED: uncharacterized oxidoreductase YrbE-like [Priapulus caudatus]|uniref:Uncharacterized oxidoreductase YrbE-like n=1 Tax=Priapulus caudatus TaxID=37621 RepID=A0ABM1ERA5_PRICU|nr:PREDICTED: uncharacterized oxidoreductase YrbE-like [Priapulus caudatus]